MENDALHILLADDDADDRMFFKDAMAEIKLKTIVSFVNDGLQLMNYLHQPDIRLPNVLFLDLNMPIKNGMECLKEIRSEKRLRELAIVIYSTSGTEQDIENALVHGANIYIKKPNDFSKLKGTLAQVINRNWQYHTLGLNKENFLFSFNDIEV